jgi:hypothetical protein
VLVGATLKYIPSPQEMFGTPVTDCGKSAIQTQEKAAPSEKGAGENTAIFKHGKSDNLENEPGGQKQEYECLIAQYTRNLATFTWYLVAVTFLLALFGFWQVMVSRDTARRQLRAYIGIADNRISKVAADQTPEIDLVIKNFGETPARAVQFWVEDIFESYPLINKLPIFDFRLAKFVLFPSDSYNLTWESSTPLTTTDMNGIQNGQRSLYVHGHVRYEDAFHRIRNTWFCLRYGGEFCLRSSKMGYADEGNETD